ncbi:hypothetical protein BJ912DRAFT_965684 [Pholiota molesta]|nr:hypothetical protein BJ912DRAFT_965684 [Pholiota molesta]
MACFRYIAASIMLMASVMLTGAVPTPLPCVILQPGDYTIQSVTTTPGVPLSPGEPNTFGNIIVMENNPQPGVWRLANADQGGYHILNVGLARNVTTLHLIESNLFLPIVAPANTPAVTFAIQCAGGGEYVIKNVDADQLFTPTNSALAGVSNIELLPSTGSRTQHWNFIPA